MSIRRRKIIFKMKLKEKIEAIIFFSGEPIAIELLAETRKFDTCEISKHTLSIGNA